MHIGRVQFSVDLARFDLAEVDLFFDVVDDHQEMFAFLGVSAIIIRHSDDSAIVFHDDGGEFEGDAQFLAKSDDEIEFLRKSEYCPGFGMGGGGGDGGLLYAAVIKRAGGTVE